MPVQPSVPEWPSYLRLMKSGELAERVKRAEEMFSACVSCGRQRVWGLGAVLPVSHLSLRTCMSLA